MWSSLWQLSLPTGTGFFGTVETSPFTVFFHVLICGIVLVTLLLSLDTLPEDSHHQGEYYALVVFGAVGMCLLTSAVELLVVFIALEISSIATYILAGYRKQTGQRPRSRHQVFPARFVRHGVSALHGHPTAVTADLPRAEAEALFGRVRTDEAETGDAERFRGQMLVETAAMSLDDGLVLQLHAGRGGTTTRPSRRFGVRQGG